MAPQNGIFGIDCFRADFFFLRFYLFIKDTGNKRETETQAEGEAGSMQGAGRGTRSQVSRITPRAAGGAKPLSHRGCPERIIFKKCRTQESL